MQIYVFFFSILISFQIILFPHLFILLSLRRFGRNRKINRGEINMLFLTYSYFPCPWQEFVHTRPSIAQLHDSRHTFLKINKICFIKKLICCSMGLLIKSRKIVSGNKSDNLISLWRNLSFSIHSITKLQD